MTSITSFPKRLREFRQVYCWTIKKNIGMMVLLTALMFLFCPLILLIQFPKWIESAFYNDLTTAERLRSLSSGFTSMMQSYMPLIFIVLLGLVALILCVTLFGYLQNKRSVDLFHSMPVGRISLMLGRWFAGLTILYVPLLFNVSASHLIGAAYGVGVNDPAAEPFVQMLWIMLMAAAVFTFSMFMAVCSGTVFDTLISILGVNVGYPLTVLCALSLASMLVPGFGMDPGDHLQLLSAFAPFVAAVMPFAGVRTAGFLVWWLVLTMVLVAGSCLLYLLRKSEAAEDAFAIPVPKIIIRFLMTTVGGMAFGLILSTNNNRSAFFIGVLTGSLIAHAIVEAVYSRGFKRMKQSMSWYGVFALCFVAFYGILATGMFGFDTRVPDVSEVRDVKVEAYGVDYAVTGGGCGTIYDSRSRYLMTLKPDLWKPENIQTVIGAQQEIIKNCRKQFPYTLRTSNWQQLKLTYTLKNGKTVYRSYNSYSDEDSTFAEPINEQAKRIISLPEFVQSSDMVFYVEPEDVKSVDVAKGEDPESITYVPTATVKQELLEAIQKDLVNHKVNLVPKDDNNLDKAGLARISVAFIDNIQPKNEKLKQILGNYQGTINLNGGGDYRTYYADSEVYQLLKKQGWIS